jgi:hypothetical protein
MLNSGVRERSALKDDKVGFDLIISVRVFQSRVVFGKKEFEYASVRQRNGTSRLPRV